mmetsp:Transcript_10639/g.15577  ORF Transcript_10639/g.15577 Transcript_10639/m.15577 type:complete len:118 (+) Transcript_10639:35-388(+)
MSHQFKKFLKGIPREAGKLSYYLFFPFAMTYLYTHPSVKKYIVERYEKRKVEADQYVNPLGQDPLEMEEEEDISQIYDFMNRNGSSEMSGIYSSQESLNEERIAKWKRYQKELGESF